MIVLHKNRYYHTDHLGPLDNSCRDGALFGWWRQPIAPTGDVTSFMRAAIKMIDEGNRGNAALVLIKDGAISAEYYSATADSVDRDTVFATASMSKWITALGVMKLVEERRLDLDRPVEDYLSRWHLPPSQFDNRSVTARRLLAHTAGSVQRSVRRTCLTLPLNANGPS